ncbi:hypothetical protein BDZ90DRAFT_240157 [Jaminaea rosea]|uniref:chitin synthase n=1 Tax=Jaminaea rosea TaxID=1569628 RepID=A0A316URF9_9BASI|nr:hypothetical protein BDZ90DRAFT_240157 [Jaminaea rosea]PWN27867.1 hypothetical protein BDZ90DRAFT_240157 [Jaminaea rosea]
MPMRNSDFTKSFVRKPGSRATGGDTSIPIRTEAPPPLRQPTRIARSKTLTRPERFQPQVPLINPQEGPASGKSEPGSPTWRIFSLLVTFWACSPCMKACGIKDRPSQQAWREKVALVFLALCMGGFVGFITMALNRVLCPVSVSADSTLFDRIGSGNSAALGIQGWDFDVSQAKLPGANDVGVNLYTMASTLSGFDVTPLFTRTDFPACAGKTAAYATADSCTPAEAGQAKCPLGALTTAHLAELKLTNMTRRVGYGWDDLGNATFRNYIVLDGNVLNLTPYINAHPTAIANDKVDLAIRTQLTSIDATGGRDATKLFYSSSETKDAVRCLVQKYYAGHIDKVSPGCFVSDLFLYVSLVIILGLVFVRFLMAIFFSWFMSAKMSAPPKEDGRRKLGHSMLPNGAMSTVDDGGAAPWAGAGAKQQQQRRLVSDASSQVSSNFGSGALNRQTIGNEPYIICLVTAYSEGEEGISNTLTSLAECDYPDTRKLLFVVADGMVTGSGESQSTPDICVSLLEADERFGTPMPMSFVSVAQGKKQHNMAMVYAGHYVRAGGHRTPMVVVVKCGTSDEFNEAKPGNRGKRDSQMILMNFLQRVTYNDRMTPLDFDLFRKFQGLMGVTPDFFELILMVDADTKVFPQGMRKLSNAMMRDHMIMGACGETRIANKTASWVTAIQVFEYFISHHMVKSFESVFGGVTCLPGCFSMYRIKARKPSDDDWVPIIVKPEVTREYSQSTVVTLHQKNLLLLGEDRFLTTLLLRTFPNRKMVFVPQARCRTEVPHTFKMLLSQRRRWINSTIHNLMELVLVRDLCGTFCFSMQFVVFMDLIGTAVLPVAICLTYVLIVSYCLDPPHTFSQAIPLMLLIAVIGLPAVLILMATRKVVYVMWMGVYLIFLPVWNFILPVYAFWHFDDFSWGETRKVEGEAKGAGHGDAEGTFAAASVPFRRWEDWERSRLKKQKREEKRRREMEEQYGGEFWNDQQQRDAGAGLQPRGRRDSDSFSDTTQEDVWGAQIGVYEEAAPPPTRIVRHTMIIDSNDVLGAGELEAMLEKEGFEQPAAPKRGASRRAKGNGPSGQPLAPSRAQARRSVRFSQAHPMPQRNNNNRHGNGSPTSASSPHLHPGNNGHDADPLRRTPSPLSTFTQHSTNSFVALGEEVSLMRGVGGELGSATSSHGGFALEDLGPQRGVAGSGQSSATSTGASPYGFAGGQQGHARQRSQGSGQQYHRVDLGGRGPPQGGRR